MHAARLRRSARLALLPALMLLATAPPARAEGQKEGDPWWAPVVLDASLGVPKLKNDDFALVGDATLGYSTPQIGLVGRGSLRVFNIVMPDTQWDTFRSGGSGEAWYVTGDETSGGRFEVRVSGGGSVFDSTTTKSQAGQFRYLRDENSVLGRGSMLLGGRVKAGNTFSASALLGGGFQYEWYDSTTKDGVSDTLLSDTTDTSFQAQGRLRLRWAFIPQTLALRTYADGSYFQLTRDNSFIVANSSPTITSTQSTVKTLDVTSRLFIDLDALSLFDIAPALFGGIDYLGLSTDGGSTSVLVPSAGIGIFKTSE
jgi:hypothetical protein